jgi:hypothetical protein
MNESPERIVTVVVRVGMPGQPAFVLRKGEEGLSVFDPQSVEPALTDEEILDAFRPGSVVVHRPVSRIEELGMRVIPTEGADVLPDRPRAAHCEIRPGPGMVRGTFKAALKELE